jgi:hypothetical protein
MQKLKPVTIIALDPHAAGFCAAVRRRLERDFGARGRLIQTYSLIHDGNTLNFESNLTSTADLRFDLRAARSEAKRLEAEEAHALFERVANSIEPALIEMLGAGRSSVEIDEARRENIEIMRRRMIFLVFSSSDSFASGLVLDLARQIRWLFANKFTQELFDLQSIVLLPGLFEWPETPDYAATYALLKKLDYSMTTGLRITSMIKGVPPFEGCWLIDGYNARGDKIGSLAEQLQSYCDAFTGFLTSEPEMSGALIGTRLARGKAPAYSAFGYGELYFPVETILTRLSSALARDLTTHAFLADDAPPPNRSRKMFQAAKEFVLSKDYTGALNGMERVNGKLIWQEFPRVEKREGTTREHISELQRRHKQFEETDLPGFQRAADERRIEVQAELEAMVDAQIDRRADAALDGLSEAREFLEALTDPNIALRRDGRGENPQNLITEQRNIEGTLDDRLGITIDRTETQKLLSQVHELRERLTALQTSLRLAPEVTDEPDSTERPRQSATADIPVEGETGRAGVADQSQEESSDTGAPEKKPLSLQEERQQLADEIKATEQQIQATHLEYHHVITVEDLAARQLRYETRQQVREAKAQAVTAAEEEVVKVSEQLGEARITLDELQQERRAFLIRHFITIPIIAVVVIFGLPALAAMAGFPPAQTLAQSFWDEPSDYLFWLAIAALIYGCVVLYLFAVGINRRVNHAKEQVKTLERSLSAANAQLRQRHNDQLHFEYELYAQRMRVETINNLIEVVKQRAKELRRTLDEIAEVRAVFARRHDEALPLFSAMRRPVLRASDMDAYYEKKSEDALRDGLSFVNEHLPRSKARRIEIEEFREKLEAFASSRFERLKTLSIEDVLLREPELLSAHNASLYLRELNDAAEPLVQLREIDIDHDLFAQRDITLWAGVEEHEQLLSSYRLISPHATARASEDEQTLRALTRCLNYPAYFLSQIDYYRACYDRALASDKEASSLPDLIPNELGIGVEVQRAYENLLLAIATGMVLRNPKGDYIFASDHKRSLGPGRKQIAEKLATDFSSQHLYAELCDQLEARLNDRDLVYQKLTEYTDSATDLESAERELLKTLTRKYHPLQ